MPTVDTEVTIACEIDFSVWCHSCGTGICNNFEKDEKLTKKNNSLHYTVFCHVCQKEKEVLDRDVDRLKAEVSRLENEVIQLTHEVDNLQYQLDNQV